MNYKALFIFLFAVSFLPSHAQFVLDEINNEFLGQDRGGDTAAWADLDGDGDLDLVIAPPDWLFLELYENRHGVFFPIETGAYGTNGGSIDAADYDGDGDQDLLVTRARSIGVDDFYARLYQNNGMVFSLAINSGLPGVASHDGKWGDYDGDGDPDVAVIAKKNGKFRGVIYRNDGGYFTDIGADLPVSEEGSLDWADYGNDGDLDLLITGYDPLQGVHSSIYVNNDGVFEDLSAGLEGVMYSTGRWGDYDNDGDLDVVITGSTISIDLYPFGLPKSVIYRNDNGVFTDIESGIDDLLFSHVEWGDMDNDGDLDLLLTGLPSYQDVPPVSKIYQYADGAFTDSGIDLPGTVFGEGLWSDYNDDGVLDFLLVGHGSWLDDLPHVKQLYTTAPAVHGPPVALPQNLTLELDGAGVATVQAGDLDLDSYDPGGEELTFSVDKSEFSCVDVGENTVEFTVTDASDNTSTASITVTVVDAQAPVVQAQDVTLQVDADGNATLSVDQVDNGSTDNCSFTSSLSKTAFSCADVGENTVEFSITDAGGNTSTASVTVTVVDAQAPVVQSQDVTLQLDAEGNATLSVDQVDNGSTDNCSFTSSLSKTSFTCAELGENTVDFTLTDASGNTSTASVTVTVVDAQAPVVQSQDVTLQLDADGNATLSVDQVENGSTDNCSFASSLSKTFFTCAELGENSVDFTLTDASGNTSTASVTVTVVDAQAPVVQSQDVTLQLGADGNATLSVDQVDNGSTDNCSFTSSLSKTAFSCADVGENTVEFSVTDAGGNTATAMVTITVVDAQAPVVQAQDVTLQLDADGNATLSVDQVDNGSTDNCSFTSSLSKTSFTCAELGENTVDFTLTDASGNTSTASATITVVDAQAPIVSTKDITLYLDAQGKAILAAGQVDNGTTDNCSFTASLSKTAFDCSDLGEHQVSYKATDASGNESTAVVSVNVLDELPPQAALKNIVINLDEEGNGRVAAAEVDDGSTDNCFFVISLSKETFTCDDLGENEITVTLTDGSGNETQATVIVTVEGVCPAEQPGALGVEDNLHQLTVYPNPTSNRLFLSPQSPFEQGDQLRIVDSSGKIVLTVQVKKKTEQLELTVGNLERGIYQLMVFKANKWARTPFIKD
ncbi:MAG: FG-GAP-like repeat-containing protein [Imperialibacter sp.]|uniref:FG-GAP-like repeat-containing protein n=1 Tax=Imperialibacter sp. TaxID=2038411 RepID=UPI003A846C62